MATVATLEPVHVSVEPGAQGSSTVRIRNTGSTVERFDLTIVGPLAAWAAAQPASLSLFPGQEGQASIVFAPPREPSPRAGTFAFAVRIAPAANPRGAVVEEGRVTIGPFTDASAKIVPTTSRGSRRGRHDVTVENRGNAPVPVSVSASDPDRLLVFAVQPDRVVVGPGEQAGFAVTATAKDTFVLGTRQSHPFDVEITAGRAPPISLRGTLLQGPLLPAWIPPLGGLAVAVVAGLIALMLLRPDPTPPPVADVSPTPAPTVEPTPSPTEVTPTESAEPDTSPDVSPGATATPGPFRLALADESSQPFSGALRLRCPASDAACRNDAREVLTSLIRSLTVRYDGYGIPTPRSTTTPNTLPVLLTRDAPFTWTADAGTSGESSVFVVDLAPLLADPPSYAYAVVDVGDGTSTRFVLPRDPAMQLFDLLFEPAPQVVLPPIDLLPTRPEIGVVYEWNNAFYTHLFSQFSPSP